MSSAPPASQVPEYGPAFLPRHGYGRFRWGMYVLTMLFLVLVLMAGMLPYPAVLTASVTLRTDHPIAHVHVRIAGELEQVRAKVGDTVAKGEVLAVIKGLTPYATIEGLKQMLDGPRHSPTLTNRDPQAPLTPERFPTAVGPDLQVAYQHYSQTWQELDQLSQYPKKELSEDKWNWVIAQARQAVVEQELLVQQTKMEEQWAKTTLDRNRILHDKGVIATQDLESMENNYGQKEKQWQLAKWDLAGKRSELERLKVERSMGANAMDREQGSLELEWAMARQELAAQIKDWEEKHLLTSPVSGKLVHSGAWGAHQVLKNGERVFSIAPLEPPTWTVYCRVPLYNAGQLKKGQPLLIDLENFPRREFGELKGELVSISGVPYQGHYTAEARLYSNVTTYGKKIQLAPELVGTAEIVIENHSVLGSLFQSLAHSMDPIQNLPIDD